MAVKAIVEVRRFRTQADGAWLFYVTLHETTLPFRFAEDLECVTALQVISSSLGQIQAALATFAKAWTTENWGTVWIPTTDSMRITTPNVTNVNA